MMNNIIPQKSIEIYSKLMSQLSPTKVRTAIFQLLSALLGAIAAKIYQKVAVKMDPEVRLLQKAIEDNKGILDSCDIIIRDQESKRLQGTPSNIQDTKAIEEQKDKYDEALKPVIDKLGRDVKNVRKSAKQAGTTIDEMSDKIAEYEKQAHKEVERLHDEESRIKSEIDNNNRSHQDTIQKLQQQRDALLNLRDNKQNS